MRICVIAGGPGISSDASGLIAGCDSVICADSGADYAIANGIVPDTVYGDLDSLSPYGKKALEDNKVPIVVYPTQKNYTDTEIALDAVPEDAEILLLCTLAGRIDHVMANLGIAMRKHKEGKKITLTDGITDIIPLSGPETVTVDGLTDPGTLAVSLIPSDINGVITGVTTSGLQYPLDNADIRGGYSLTVSNCVCEGEDSISISVKKGNLFLVITDKHL